MFGERLRLLRKSANMKQQELATILGIKVNTVSQYETNLANPSDGVKIEIAKHFNVSLDYLMGITDDLVPYYSDKVFLRIPENISNDNRKLLADIISFIDYRTQNEINTTV